MIFACGMKMTEGKYTPEVVFTKDTLDVTLMGELSCVFCEDLGENWLCFNDTVLCLDEQFIKQQIGCIHMY